MSSTSILISRMSVIGGSLMCAPAPQKRHGYLGFGFFLGSDLRGLLYSTYGN